MKWSKVGDFVKGSLPVLGSALGGPAGGKAGELLADLLGVENEPDAVIKALESDPDALLKYKIAELEQNSIVVLASQESQALQIESINKTMRSESNSSDKFVRRWRPFYGYSVAIAWAIQMIGFTFMFVYIALNRPEELAALVQQFALLSGSLVTLWGIALAVLGVSVHQRSQDKKLGSGAKGLLENLIKK